LVLWEDEQDQTLPKLTKRRSEKTQIDQIRDEKGNITTDTNENSKDHMGIF
jgi:hypothetical protein